MASNAYNFLRELVLTAIAMISLISMGHSQDINTITFNIKYDDKSDKPDSWKFRKEELVYLLKDHSPHILGIQEALVHQVEYLNDAFVNHTYLGVGRDDGDKGGEFCALLIDTTNFNIIDSSTFWLSESPDTVSVGWDAALERICTYALLEYINSKRKLWVFNTHFDHIGEQARFNSINLIKDKIAMLNSDTLPVILMGDFNLLPESAGIIELSKSFEDCFDISSAAPTGPTGTFNGFDDRMIEDRIDYIFTIGFQVSCINHILARLPNGRHISDHLPVHAVIRFK